MNCKFVDSDISFYHFTDDGFSCKIVPAFGGSIQELIVDDQPVIKGVSIDEKGIEEYKEFCNSAVLFPFPNRIAKGAYNFGDQQYQLTVNEPRFGNAIHGFVYSECPEVVAETDTSLTLRFTHHDSPGYPFPYVLELEYSLNPKGLRLQMKVSNTGDNLLPFGLGWHPYFVTENQDKTSLHFVSDKKYLTNENMIPDHSTPVNYSEMQLSDLEVDNAYRLASSEIALKGPGRILKRFCTGTVIIKCW